MAQSSGLYFVIANGERARFVRPGQDDRLHTIVTVDAAALNPRDSAPPADRHAARGPPASFTRLLVERINEDCAADVFTNLVLVAPPDILRELIAILALPTVASLAGRLAMDLFDLPDPALRPHLFPWLDPSSDVR
jgi:Bacterial archaeo-eukaryotic release factor family 12